MDEKKALLVIDMQKDNIAPEGPYPFPQKSVEELIQQINQLTSQYKANAHPVFFVRQIYKNFWGRLISRLFLKGITLEGSDGANLDERLNASNGLTIDKTQQNAFANTSLQSQLSAFDISTVVICGLDGAYCVGVTAHAALRAGFKVELLDQAILTTKADRWAKIKADLKAKGASLI